MPDDATGPSFDPAQDALGLIKERHSLFRFVIFRLEKRQPHQRDVAASTVTRRPRICLIGRSASSATVRIPFVMIY
jgi:hypothetical protein